MAARHRGKNPRSATQQVLDKEKVAKALELRRAGLNYGEIAKALGYASRQSAHKIVERALQEIIEEPGKDVLKLELARLDRMFRGLATKGVFDGDPKAVQAGIRIMDRRAKYLGLDAPEKIDATVHQSVDGARAAQDDLIARLTRLSCTRATGEDHPEPVAQ